MWWLVLFFLNFGGHKSFLWGHWYPCLVFWWCLLGFRRSTDWAMPVRFDGSSLLFTYSVIPSLLESFRLMTEYMLCVLKDNKLRLMFVRCYHTSGCIIDLVMRSQVPSTVVCKPIGSLSWCFWAFEYFSIWKYVWVAFTVGNECTAVLARY